MRVSLLPAAVSLRCGTAAASAAADQGGAHATIVVSMPTANIGYPTLTLVYGRTTLIAHVERRAGDLRVSCQALEGLHPLEGALSVRWH